MDPIYRQQSLFTRCTTCAFRHSCDQPIAPCPPIRGTHSKPDKADMRMISPINPHLWNWIRSVGGHLELDIAFPKVALPTLPQVVPAVPIRLSGTPANLPVVGITLSRVMASNGKFRYASRDELLSDYGLAPTTRLVLVCAETDPPLEHFWHNAIIFGPDFYEAVANFGFIAAIGPNYSIFLQRSPLEHQVNYKRSLIVAANLSKAGLPTIPHAYAAGPRALERLVTWLREESHITTIARELQTSKTSRVFHDAIVTTKKIIEGVGRPLHVVFIGPRTKTRLEELVRHFDNFSMVTSNGAMLAANRRQLVLEGSHLKTQHDPALIPTRTFEQNTRTVEHLVEHLNLKHAHECVPMPDAGAPLKSPKVALPHAAGLA